MTLVVDLHPNGLPLNAVVLVFEAADSAPDIELPATITTTAPAGWDTPGMNQTIENGKKRIYFSTVTGVASDADPLRFTMKITQKGSGFKGTKIKMLAWDGDVGEGSNASDPDFNTVPLPEVTTSIVSGASRDLGGPMNNAVSAAPGVIAAAAGNSLHLLNAADDGLAAAAGWETPKPLDGPVSGRPAFGAIDGKLAVVVGTDAGSLYAFDAASGAAAGSYKGDFVSIPTAPAVGADGNVYVAGRTAEGVSVARVKLAGNSAALGEAFAVAGATQVQSSPAVAGSGLVVGTNNAVFRGSVDAAGVVTPQAAAGTAGVDFNTSPVVSGAFAYVGDSTGKVHQINLATGAVANISAALPVPLSNPFAQGGNVHFGAGDGKVYTFANGDVTAAPRATDVGSTPVVSPVDTGDLLVAATEGGIVKAGTDTVDLGSGIGKAVVVIPGADASAAATVIVNKVDGTVLAIPTK